jgi:2-polyprenyl-3-methyl-5-hydroxy-6-metoxy-1,4-benzoquinol methylase
MVQSIDRRKLDILDIGCNNGLTGRTLCESLSEKEIETNIDGIDFVEEATRIAKDRFNYRDVFVADITNKNLVSRLLGERKYQAVICCEVFHYLHPNDYDSLLTTVSSYLMPDGYFILVLPNVRSVYHIVKKTHHLLTHFLSSRSFSRYFKYTYDLELIRSILDKNGFDIASIYGVDLVTNINMDLKKSDTAIKRLFSAEYAFLAVNKLR